MAEIETMSHVALLGLFHDTPSNESEHEPLRAEILRRMDSACTSRRQEIEPHRPDHQR